VDFEHTPLGKAQREELLRIRKQLGLTQAEAAKRVGCATNQWQRYEWGWRPAPLAFIRKAEAKLLVTLDIRAEPTSGTNEISADQRRGVLLAVRQVRALLDDLVEEAMGATPRVPAEVRGIHAAIQAAEPAPRGRKPKLG